MLSEATSLCALFTCPLLGAHIYSYSLMTTPRLSSSCLEVEKLNSEVHIVYHRVVDGPSSQELPSGARQGNCWGEMEMHW